MPELSEDAFGAVKTYGLLAPREELGIAVSPDAIISLRLPSSTVKSLHLIEIKTKTTPGSDSEAALFAARKGSYLELAFASPAFKQCLSLEHRIQLLHQVLHGMFL